MCGVFFLGCWGLGERERGGGTRSHGFNSGYHDLGLLQVDYHWLFMYTCQTRYYSYAKDVL